MFTRRFQSDVLLILRTTDCERIFGGDVCDNCSKRASPNQLNTNRDPYENVFDLDYKSAGGDSIPDFNVLRS